MLVILQSYIDINFNVSTSLQTSWGWWSMNPDGISQNEFYIFYWYKYKPRSMYISLVHLVYFEQHMFNPFFSTISNNAYHEVHQQYLCSIKMCRWITSLFYLYLIREEYYWGHQHLVATNLICMQFFQLKASQCWIL